MHIIKKQYLKRIISILLLFILITTTSCTLPSSDASNTTASKTIHAQPPASYHNTVTAHDHSVYAKNDNVDFANYTKTVFQETVTSDMITLHSYLEHPETADITDYDVTLGRYDLEQLDETGELSDTLTKLQSFDYAALSKNQQLTYDALEQLLVTQLEYADLSLFSTQLSTTIGLQVQLPLIFAEYTLSEEKDIVEYLTLLEDTDAFFENLVAYEKIRAEKGYFMEEKLATDIIKQCETFVSSAKDGFLITTFAERINKIDTLSEETKNEYIKRNQAGVSEHFIRGYQILIDGLKDLSKSNRYTGGLCNYPNGDKYYEYLLKKDIGWSKSVDELNALADSYLQRSISTMQHLMAADSTLSDALEHLTFSATEPSAMLADLKKRIADDFPTPPDVDCSIHYITKSLADYASPAMYFTPQIDNLTDNSIYINPKEGLNDHLYTTMAHEGYPGHMYQMTYFTNTKPDNIRYLIEPVGYVEGWATYCELYAYQFANTDNASLKALAQANYATVLLLYAKMDMGIHYYHWTLDDIVKFLSNYGYDADIANDIYYSIVSEPENYCKYVIGYIGFSELKKAAKEKLGDRFTNKSFHQFVMDLGPVSFDILFDRLNSYEP